MEDQQLAELHKALSVPIRLKILRLISERPLCVNAVTHCLGISQPAVSQHLAVLRRAGLVQGRKSGYMVHYTLNWSGLRSLRRAMAAFPPEARAGARRLGTGAARAGSPKQEEPMHRRANEVDG
jgi:DNA-binding transcriptional ArsR family regulator